MFWFALLLWAAFTVAYEIIRPKPTFENARPAGMGDFNFPTATEGRAVPLVWGTCKITGPNLIWYGNFGKVARTEEVKTGMFSSETVTIGYRYYIGLQMAICHGVVDAISGVWCNEKRVSSHLFDVDGETAAVSHTTLYGGEEHGSGGISGDMTFYSGSTTQAVDSYLDLKISGDVPAYRGTCHMVWSNGSQTGGGWIGNSSNLSPFAFEVRRVPDGLNLASSVPAAHQPNLEGNGASDANPMNVLYEILTDTDWGLSISSADIDTTNFQEAGETLFDEGNGFSMVIDNAIQISTLIEEIQRQIDGSLYFDRGQGQWKVKLARDDYSIPSLTTLDESNILELKEFTRQTWEETTNQVRVQYTARSLTGAGSSVYQETYAMAQDPANMDIQGQTVQSDVRYPGVKVQSLASDLAWRDLRAMSYPLAKIKITVNRGMWAAAPGSPFVFNWARLGISDLVMRVAKINYGGVGDSKIEIFAIQDIFAAATAVYGDAVGSGWDEPTDGPAYATAGNTLMFECPKQIVEQDSYNDNLNPRVWMSCRHPGDGTVNMRAYIQTDTIPPGGTYAEDAAVYGFVRTGTLDGALGPYGTTAARPDTGTSITVDMVDDLALVEVDGGPELVENLSAIGYINGEFIGWETATDIGGSQIRLNSIYRGLFNSAPQYHADSSTIWFLSLGGNLTKKTIPSSHDEALLQLRGVNGSGEETTELETPEISLHLDRIWLNPLAPRDPYINGTFADPTIALDTQYLTETGRTGDDARALEVEVTPRDWLVDSPLTDTTLTANWDSYLPEFDFTLTLGVGVEDIEVLVEIDDDSTTPTAYILRNDIILACGANQVIPTDGEISVIARHWASSAWRESDPLQFIFTSTTSSLQGNDDLTHGAVDNGTSPNAVIYGETGSYSFDIKTALPSSGTLEARINAGSWATVISAGNSTGSLAVTAADSVELRWQTSGPAADQFFDITGPTSEMGYGVLTA